MICNIVFEAKLNISDVCITCRLFTECPFYRVSEHGINIAEKCRTIRDIASQLPFLGTR